MTLPYSMPEDWTHGDPCWGTPGLVKPLTGSHAGMSMHCESALAKTLGFKLNATQVGLLYLEFVSEKVSAKVCKSCPAKPIVVSLITRYGYCKECWNRIYRATRHRIK